MNLLSNNHKKFWLIKSKDLIWEKKPKKVLLTKKRNHFFWFPDGKLNIYKNLIEKNLFDKHNKKFLITVNNFSEVRKFNYLEIDKLVNHCIFLIRNKNKNKIPKRVLIHSSASIESAICMLACCKMGIFFSVVFEDLPTNAILKRINLFKPEIIISRSDKMILSLKKKIKNKKFLKLSLKNLTLPSKKKIEFKSRTVSATKKFFCLFTSGSTGEPKGIVHSVAGYLLYSKFTASTQFGMNSKSIVCTASDAGWMNGHTYALFGPLLHNSTTILLETPMLLLKEKVLKKILSLKTTILYLPVTLIRLMKSVYNSKYSNKNSLLTLGSMGEPLAKEIAFWFSNFFLRKNKPIVNAYYQTENGAIISSPKFSDDIKKTPHGSVGRLTYKYMKTCHLQTKNKKELIIRTPWPGCMTDVINGEKIWNKYWDKNNFFRMFDLATIKNKNLYIHGRTDDVINIRGHRIGSEEIESVVLSNKSVIECCAVSCPDYFEGDVFYLFLVKGKYVNNKIINNIIYNSFGKFALPKQIYTIPEMPKTRSGKILRRVLRDIIINKNSISKKLSYGDLSTMLNPNLIKKLENVVND